ncbi:MAG: hypothetical protein ACJ74O_10840 [Frankiaceae bacterium]
MSWSWRYESAAGEQVSSATAPAAEPFATRSDAESWLGENYRELLSAGIDQVTLLQDGAASYTMSLHPAEEE